MWIRAHFFRIASSSHAHPLAARACSSGVPPRLGGGRVRMLNTPPICHRHVCTRPVLSRRGAALEACSISDRLCSTMAMPLHQRLGAIMQSREPCCSRDQSRMAAGLSWRWSPDLGREAGSLALRGFAKAASPAAGKKDASAAPTRRRRSYTRLFSCRNDRFRSVFEQVQILLWPGDPLATTAPS